MFLTCSTAWVEQTSSSAQQFCIRNRKLRVDLDIENNEWAALLRDSYLMATYAIVNEAYLECRPYSIQLP